MNFKFGFKGPDGVRPSDVSGEVSTNGAPKEKAPQPADFFLTPGTDRRSVF